MTGRTDEGATATEDPICIQGAQLLGTQSQRSTHHSIHTGPNPNWTLALLPVSSLTNRVPKLRGLRREDA